jgi:hypothetical protein
MSLSSIPPLCNSFSGFIHIFPQPWGLCGRQVGASGMCHIGKGCPPRITGHGGCYYICSARMSSTHVSTWTVGSMPDSQAVYVHLLWTLLRQALGCWAFLAHCTESECVWRALHDCVLFSNYEWRVLPTSHSPLGVISISLSSPKKNFSRLWFCSKNWLSNHKAKQMFETTSPC